MGHVDVSDQLRNYYRFDHWMRKTKWWWSNAFWGIGVLLVNSYVVYDFEMKKNKVPKSKSTQYDFRKQIALAWIGGIEEDHDVKSDAKLAPLETEFETPISKKVKTRSAVKKDETESGTF